MELRDRDRPEALPVAVPRRPEVFYDPRALEADPGKHAVLHATCLIVDHEVALVSSANFTSAALDRNIEAGVLIRLPQLAVRLEERFESLVATGALKPLFLPDVPSLAP